MNILSSYKQKQFQGRYACVGKGRGQRGAGVVFHGYVLSAEMTRKAVKDVPELNLTKGGFLCWIKPHFNSDLTLNYLHQCEK